MMRSFYSLAMRLSLLTPLSSVLAAAVFVSWAAPQTAEATIIVPRSLSKMSTDSAVVVRGQVVQVQAAWDDKHRRIHTYTEIQVEEVVYSQHQVADSIVVRTMGGVVGDTGMNVAGVARFVVGEEAVLFLRVDPMKDGQYQVVGMAQGKYTVDRSQAVPTAVAHVEGLAFARRNADGKMDIDHHDDEVAPTHLPLSELVGRVKVAVGAVPTPQNPVVPTPTTPVTPPVAPGQ